MVKEDLNENQYQELQSLCSDVQGVLQGKPRCTMVTELSIPTGSSLPVRQAPYRLPYAHREWMKKEIEAMLWIEPSMSDWASPIILIEKKDGGIRFCVDYCKLNAVTQGDAYPMPRVDELLDQLGNSQYMTSLDLARGYWQVLSSRRTSIRLPLPRLMACTTLKSCLLAYAGHLPPSRG